MVKEKHIPVPKALWDPVRNAEAILVLEMCRAYLMKEEDSKRMNKTYFVCLAIDAVVEKHTHLRAAADLLLAWIGKQLQGFATLTSWCQNVHNVNRSRSGLQTARHAWVKDMIKRLREAVPCPAS